MSWFSLVAGHMGRTAMSLSDFVHLQYQRDTSGDQFDLKLVQYFVTMQLVGGVGVAVTLLTALLSSKVRRHPTWISFCVAWIISVVSYTLLTLVGQQVGPPPTQALCITQSALIYAAPVLTSATTLALVFQLFFNLTSMLSRAEPRANAWRTITLLIVPYSLWFIIFVEALVVGIFNRPNIVRAPSGVYCIMKISMQGKISAMIVVGFIIILLGIETYIGTILFRNWRAFRTRGEASSQALGMLLRASLFTFFGVLSVLVSAAFIADISGPLPNIFIALTPVEAVLVFGTQRDIVKAWVFWGKKGENEMSPIPPPKDADELTSTGSV